MSLNQINLLSLFEDPMGTLGVIVALAVNQAEQPLESSFTEALFQDGDDTEVLDGDRASHDIESCACELEQGKLVGTFAIFVTKVLDITYRLHSQQIKHFKVRHQRIFIKLRLVNRSDFLRQPMEGFQFQITAEGITVERHLVEVARGHQ